MSIMIPVLAVINIGIRVHILECIFVIILIALLLLMILSVRIITLMIMDA